MISNDVAERHWQLERACQRFRGQSIETFNRLDDLSKSELKLILNGKFMQLAQLWEMIHDVPYLVWDISQVTTLEPSDVVNTGAPNGVGPGLKPPRYLREGDRVELSITAFGCQLQTVAKASR